MKHPCAWCGQHPVVYRGTEYCSYQCWVYSLHAVKDDPVQEEAPPSKLNGVSQLDLFEKLMHTR